MQMGLLVITGGAFGRMGATGIGLLSMVGGALPAGVVHDENQN